jgi:hypothetical protein
MVDWAQMGIARNANLGDNLLGEGGCRQRASLRGRHVLLFVRQLGLAGTVSPSPTASRRPFGDLNH